MRPVAVIGVGLSAWGELWRSSLRDLFAQAALAAIKDSGAPRIDSLLVGCMSGGLFNSQEHRGLAGRRLRGPEGDPCHPRRVRLRLRRGGLPHGRAGGGLGRQRLRLGRRRGEDDGLERRRRHLRPLHRGGFRLRGLSGRHLPGPLRHDGARPHGALTAPPASSWPWWRPRTTTTACSTPTPSSA